MKTKYLLAAVAFSSIFSNVKADNDPVIMKINGRDISKSEFEYIYNKNTQQQMAEQKSLDEYVDLFVNFKLKVFEAEKRGLDTLKTFVDELEGYRSQLAKPYLIDKDMDEKLIKEAYDRLKENIKVSHILLRLDPNATAFQEKAVYERMVEFKKKVEAGYDFNQLASEVSEDNSAKQNGGLLGYITGFMTVYPFETAAYTTPVGSVSDPVKTTFGYHLVYVMDRRADQGEFLASHIMKKVDLDADKKADNEAKKAIDEIYAKIVAGENFQELAKQNSDDYGSARQGGQLP